MDLLEKYWIPPADQALTLHPRRLRKWLAALPLTNMGETTRRFYQGLLEANSHSVNPARRLVAMEILLPTAQLILTNIRRRLLNQTFPLSHRTHKIYELQQSIASELCTAYRLVVDEANDDSRRNRSKLLPLAAYRSMDFGIQRIFAAANVYMADAACSWQILHELYTICEQQEILRYTILSLDKKPLTPPTIEQLFLRAVTLAVCQPRAMYRGDSDRLHLLFPELVDGCSITRHPPNPPGTPSCVVDLSAGMPPHYRRLSSLSQTDSIRHVNLGPFVGHLLDLAETGRTSSPMVGMARRLLERLAGTEGRRSERHRLRAMMSVSFGLPDICRTLRNSAPTPGPKDDPEAATDSPAFSLAPIDRAPGPAEHILIPEGLHPASGIWDIVARGCVMTDDPLDSNVMPEARPEHRRDLKPCHIWSVVDASDGGVRLRSRNCRSSLAQVGELVALHQQDEYQDDTYWALGVIRWMFHPKPAHAEIGVQFLSPRIEVVDIEAADTRMRHTFSTLDGLLLHHPDTRHTESTLIVPSGHFAPSKGMNIALDGREIRVSLREKTEQTASYERYRYAVVIQQMAPAVDSVKRPPEEEEEDVEFNSILSDLPDSESEQDDFNAVWASL